ncbi:hypothetical protein LTR08_002075 [Meristemomyces frigidus]|nr:hypothetical protein LTR08_002075 [Meristemomyces frigidus]
MIPYTSGSSTFYIASCAPTTLWYTPSPTTVWYTQNATAAGCTPQTSVTTVIQYRNGTAPPAQTQTVTATSLQGYTSNLYFTSDIFTTLPGATVTGSTTIYETTTSLTTVFSTIVQTSTEIDVSISSAPGQTYTTVYSTLSVATVTSIIAPSTQTVTLPASTEVVTTSLAGGTSTITTTQILGLTITTTIAPSTITATETAISDIFETSTGEMGSSRICQKITLTELISYLYTCVSDSNNHFDSNDYAPRFDPNTDSNCYGDRHYYGFILLIIPIDYDRDYCNNDNVDCNEHTTRFDANTDSHVYCNCYYNSLVLLVLLLNCDNHNYDDFDGHNDKYIDRLAGIQEKCLDSNCFSAGLNLNLVGAVSGMFSSKSDKKTEADGSSTEHRSEQAHVKGVGAGNLNAQAAASGTQNDRHVRVQE